MIYKVISCHKVTSCGGREEGRSRSRPSKAKKKPSRYAMEDEDDSGGLKMVVLQSESGGEAFVSNLTLEGLRNAKEVRATAQSANAQQLVSPP